MGCPGREISAWQAEVALQRSHGPEINEGQIVEPFPGDHRRFGFPDVPFKWKVDFQAILIHRPILKCIGVSGEKQRNNHRSCRFFRGG